MTREEIKSMRKISLKEKPIEVTGLPWLYERDDFERIPQDLLPAGLPDIFYEITRDNSGGIARVRTNSKRVYFSANVRMVKTYLYHMSQLGSSGCDFHIKFPGEELRYIHPTTTLQYGQTGYGTEVAVFYNSLFDGSGRKEERVGKMYELYIILPIYNCLDEAFLYVDNDAEVLPPEPYKYDKPVVFYGSSITQGACASRPSLCYTNRIALELETPIINFGFSGHAKGEEWMANLIAKQDMNIFVMDYDHNADSVGMLRDTHEKFYKIIREAHPDIPVLFVTKPDYDTTLDDNAARRKVILTTYENAKARGENVYFVDGKMFFEGARNVCLVDNCHPNDLGFDKMTCAIKPIIAECLAKI